MLAPTYDTVQNYLCVSKPLHLYIFTRTKDYELKPQNLICSSFFVKAVLNRNIICPNHFFTSLEFPILKFIYCKTRQITVQMSLQTSCVTDVLAYRLTLT